MRRPEPRATLRMVRNPLKGWVFSLFRKDLITVSMPYSSFTISAALVLEASIAG
jgi:hypothetical protein